MVDINMPTSTNSTDHYLKFTKLRKLDAKFNYFYYFQVILAKLQLKIIFVWKFLYRNIFFFRFFKIAPSRNYIEPYSFS